MILDTLNRRGLVGPREISCDITRKNNERNNKRHLQSRSD